MKHSLVEILLGETTAETFSTLESLTLQESQRPTVFGIHSDNVARVVQERFELFHLVYPEFTLLCERLKLSPLPIELLWNFWLPLAIQISQWKQQCQHQCLIQGFLGGQGTGKTTLTLILTLILKQLSYEAVSLSIDDLYLSHRDRINLQKSDPRLVRRGPPGTHDVKLGLQVLQQFREGRFPIELPQFDKSLHHGSGDRISPKLINHADIVLFEGWFVGVHPINSTFENAPAPILTDSDCTFAQDMNEQLRNYLPLWELLDRLIVLYVPDYQLSKQWRRQAEHNMIAQGKTGMSDAEIDEFVEYFWKALHPELFIQPLVEDSHRTDLVIKIDADHQPTCIYQLSTT